MLFLVEDGTLFFKGAIVSNCKVESSTLLNEFTYKLGMFSVFLYFYSRWPSLPEFKVLRLSKGGLSLAASISGIL